MSVLFNEVRKGIYLDSVALMRVSAEISALSGIEEAVFMIGTPSNIDIMRNAGMLDATGEEAGPNDLVVAIRADRKASINRAIAHAEKSMQGGQRAESSDTHRARTLNGAHKNQADANLALISTPGDYAGLEAQTALELGLNVMIFSDNVPLERELQLKQYAHDNNLLVMGADCGTAYINGVPLAFANAVNRGTVGVISASGTGLQEFSVLVHRAGGGIKHGIGVGGRDLSDSIGGISTLTAIDLLANDDEVKQIVLISKPPGEATAKVVFDKLTGCGKPVIACVFGIQANQLPDGIQHARTLRAAAQLAQPDTTLAATAIDPQPLATAISANPARQVLAGLYTGGTLCNEALLILNAAGIQCASNISSSASDAPHRLLDLGADEYTVGRPHPMIEPAVRTPLLQEAINDQQTAIILLDVVLGYGAHEDPAASIIESIAAASADLPVIVASVCGTDEDPQNYHRQRTRLEAAGVIVCNSNSEAAELCAGLLNSLAS